MKINKERTGCELSAQSALTPAELKNEMDDVSRKMSGVYVPSEVIWEGGVYKFCINHRQSLKEYIYENGFRADDFFALVRRLCALYSDASENGIGFHNFVFDYECIFVGTSVSDTEFVYAPDDGKYKDGKMLYNKCSDMMAIVSLLIEYSSSAQSQKAGTAVCDILRALSEWESDMCDDGNIFPEEEIKCILNGQKSGIGIKRVLNSIVCRAGYFLVQYRKSGSVKRKTEVSDMELSGGSLLDDIRYTADKAAEEIHIGRDKDWADIPLNLIFVSKRHAELCRQNESWYITDLSSTNGTYVDGERVMPKQPVLIHDGSRIGIGLPQSELILHLP